MDCKSTTVMLLFYLPYTASYIFNVTIRKICKRKAFFQTEGKINNQIPTTVFHPKFVLIFQAGSWGKWIGLICSHNYILYGEFFSFSPSVGLVAAVLITGLLYLYVNGFTLVYQAGWWKYGGGGELFSSVSITLHFCGYEHQKDSGLCFKIPLSTNARGKANGFFFLVNWCVLPCHF